MSTTTTPVRRPASVTFLVVLVWISAILTLLVGGLFLAGADNATVVDQFNGVADAAKAAGWVLLVLGVLTALFAIGLGRGSNFLRILVTIIFVLRIAGDVWLVLRSNYDTGAFVSIAFSVLILYLMWNSRADEFFSS